MSIHSILAVLLGSTALGGYAPLTLLRAQRYYVRGLKNNAIAAIYKSMHVMQAIPENLFNAARLEQHLYLGSYKFGIGWMIETIVYGFMGVMPSELDLHTAMQETELEGYGYLYGETYGE